MKSLVEVIRELEMEGYRETFRAEPAGLVARTAGLVIPTDDVVVDRKVRIEDGSDPDSQMLVLALHSKTTPVRGTYVVTYGPNMPAADGATLARLDM